MARIAATEDVEGLRDEEEVQDDSIAEEEFFDMPTNEEDGAAGKSKSPTLAKTSKGPRKYIASTQEVHDAFDSVTVLRYSQPCHLQGEQEFNAIYPLNVHFDRYSYVGKCQGITIIAFNAGHTLGGTIWKIRSPTAGTVLYAVDMNHMKERHLDGTVLIRSGSSGSTVFESLQRPDLLITDAERANVTTARRKDRDAALLGA